jgi:hypothetical protein
MGARCGMLVLMTKGKDAKREPRALNPLVDI